MSYDAKAGHGYQYGGPAFPGGILVGIGLGIMAHLGFRCVVRHSSPRGEGATV